MSDARRTKGQLIEELRLLRARVEELEHAGSASGSTSASQDGLRGLLGEDNAPQSRELSSAPDDLTREQKLLRMLIDSLPDQVYVKDRESRFRLVNRAVLARFGVSGPDEVIGKTDTHFFPPNEAQGYLQEERRVLETGEALVNVERCIARPGKERAWALVAKVPLRDERTGEIVGLVGMNRDITRLKRAEAEMLAAEGQYRSVLDAITDAIHVIDRDFRIVMFNQAFLDWLSYYGLRGDPRGRHLQEVVPFLPERSFDQYRQLFAGEEVPGYEFDVTVHGERLVIEVRKIPLSEGGQVVRVLTLLRNVTERKRMEESLRASEARVRHMVNSLPITLFSFEGGTNRVLLVQGDVRRMFGYEEERFLNDLKLDEKLIHPDDLAGLREGFRVGLASMQPFVVEFRIWHGETAAVRWMHQHVLPVRVAEGRLVRMDTVVVDVTERKATEQALRESEARIRQMVDSLPIVLGSFEVGTGRVLLLQGDTRSILGYDHEQVVADPHLGAAIVHPEDRAAAYAVFDRGMASMQPFSMTYRIIHGERATPVYLQRYIVPVCDTDNRLVRQDSLIIDVTAERQAQQRLKEMQSASARLAEAVKNAGEGIGIWDEQWSLIYANGAMCSNLGWERFEEVAAKEAFEYLSAEGEADPVDVRAALRRRGVWRGRMLGRHQDGSMIPLAVTFSRLRQDDDGKALYVGNIRNMSREEAQLAQIRRLGRDAAIVLDTERARISKELHDELGQQLTAMNLGLAWLGSHLGEEEGLLRDRLDEMQDLRQRMTETVRGLARSLRPALLDYQGLGEALQSLAAEYTRVGEIACRVRVVPADLDVENPLKTVIYRIAQEALTNVVRHSGATRCSIEITGRPQTVRLRVFDNGSGSDPSRLEGTESLGIVGMKERAAAVGGALRVANLPKGGVCVTAVFPRPQPAHAGG